MPLIIKLAPPGQHTRAPDPGSAWQDAGGPGLLVQPAKDDNAVRSDLKRALIYLAETLDRVSAQARAAHHVVNIINDPLELR